MVAPLSNIPVVLSSLSTSLHRPSASYLLPALVTTTLGHGPTWLPHIYIHATTNLPPAPAHRTPSPLPALDPIPRRKVLRELKEALVKSSILIGVPRVIEALLELGECVEEGARDDWFVREGLGSEAVGWGRDEVERRGVEGLGRIYRDDIHAIWTRMGSDMADVSTSLNYFAVGCRANGVLDAFLPEWVSKNITYGTFLTPHPILDNPAQSRDPLAHDPALLSVVTLSCLIPQRTPREILWHLRQAFLSSRYPPRVLTTVFTI